MSALQGQMSEFLPLEWRGHVGAFIKLTPGQKITTGGHALRGTQKVCPVSKDSNAEPVTVRLCGGGTALYRERTPREESAGEQRVL